MEVDKTKKILLIILVGLLFITALYTLPSNGSAKVYPNVSIVITGSNIIALNSTSSYQIAVSGGPAIDGGTYQYYAYLQGNNVSSTNVFPSNGTSLTGKFYINVTAPAQIENIELIVTANSTLGNVTMHGKQTMILRVIHPMSISGTIYNNGIITLNNINIKFYLDNTYIGNITISKIGPKQNYTFTYNYTIQSLSAGYHTIKMQIVNGYNLVLFSNNLNYNTVTFYVPGPVPNYTIWYEATGIVLVGVVILILLIYFTSKRNKPKKKW
jgi:hypothetical protein